MRRGVLSVSRLSSHLLSARPMSALAQQGSFPAALDLISSTDPAYWTKLVDLTASCPAAVHDFNAKNPQSKITVLGKCEHLNPGMVSRHFSKWGLVVVAGHRRHGRHRRCPCHHYHHDLDFVCAAAAAADRAIRTASPRSCCSAPRHGAT